MSESAGAASARRGHTVRRCVAVFDLDGTLTRYDTYLHYLIGFLQAHPGRIGRTWHLPLDVAVFKSGLQNNTWLKKRFLKAILGGLTEDDLSRWTQCFVDRVIESGLRPGGLAALRLHQSRHDQTILLSASPDIFVNRIAARLGFSECNCTVAARDQAGRFTGELDGDNCYGAEKLRRLKLRLGQDRPDVHVVAYADHASDFPLLCWADKGVAVNPTRALINLAGSARLTVVRW